MTDSSQKRAIENYRRRLAKRGLARFEVLGLDADRELIRSLAKRLAKSDRDAARIRDTVARTLSGEPQQKGRILEALLRSPLVGAKLLRSALSGSQDLSISESANPLSLKMWEKSGGATLPLFSLSWLRVLKPAALSLAMTGLVKLIEDRLTRWRPQRTADY